MLDESEKSKVVSLFQFLKQYNNIKNPIVVEIKNQQWHKWVDSIPEHETINNNIYKTEEDTDVLFTISKPELTECPIPPKEIKDWLEKGWNSLIDEVKIKKSIDNLEKQSYNNEEIIVKIDFYDDKNRVQALNEWKNKRVLWLSKETKSREADDIFNDFYSLYSKLKKEAEAVELMFGDGVLACKGISNIYHPILLQTVNLIFDANIPEFRIEASDKSPELYKSIFNRLDEINHELLLEIYQEFEREQFSPCEVSESSSFLKRIAHALSSDGKFIDIDDKNFEMTSYPQIFRKPVLFIRKRNMGFVKWYL